MRIHRLTLLLIALCWNGSAARRLGGPEASFTGGVAGQQYYYTDFDDPFLTDLEVEEKAQAIARRTGGFVRWVYRHVFKGVLLSDVPIGGALGTAGEYAGDANDWPVLIPDQPIQLHQTVKVQAGPPKGLDRIDQSDLPLDHQYEYSLDGTGVTIFILDSGVRATHQDFAGRSPRCAFDAFAAGRLDSEDAAFDCSDATGHGSHVSGTAAGSNFGVAKNATLVSVKVLGDDGNGSFGGMMAGLDWVIAEKKRNPDTPMVINLSLGGSRQEYANKAIDAAVDAGIVVVVAAGNQAQDACTNSPGSASKAITVGASKDFQFLFWYFESRALYSNFGSCVDIFAPGSGIKSISNSDDTSSEVKSGTSMAAPHVAGAAALLLQKDPTMTPQQVRDALLEHAAGGELFWFTLFWSPNLLLNVANL